MQRWMKPRMRRLIAVVCAVVLHSAFMARAQDNINPRAKEDLNAFLKKVEEGDRLFNEKKYAEAAAALAAAHDLYMRADRRDGNATAARFTIKPQAFPTLRYYGYLPGPAGSFKGEAGDTFEDTYAHFQGTVTMMWQDASILSNADKIPLAGAFEDPPIVELTEEKFDSIVESLYGEIRRVKLPVPDDEWRDVVLKGRRAQLILEHALQKYPAWRTGTRNWIDQPTGDAVLADIKTKLAEAEPEYKKLVADFSKAEPAGVAKAISEDVAELNQAIAGVKRNGWLDWFLARDVFLSNDYMTKRRQRLVHLYKEQGKTMPEDKARPIEDKIAELKSIVDKNASRWKFPTGKPHNAAIEARIKSQVKAAFPGVTIIKTALAGTDWTIQKNDLGLPRYRSRHALVLVKMPGQKWPWLIDGLFEQDYAGGGTYNPGGTFERFREVRIQGAQ